MKSLLRANHERESNNRLKPLTLHFFSRFISIAGVSILTACPNPNDATELPELAEGSARIIGEIDFVAEGNVSGFLGATLQAVGQIAIDVASVLFDGNRFYYDVNTSIRGSRDSTNTYQLLIHNQAQQLGTKHDVDLSADEINTIAAPLVLGRTGSISGWVSLSTAGDPTGTLVFIPGTSFIATADSSGAFSIEGVPSGNYDNVRAQKDGFYEVVVSDIAVNPDSDLYIEELQLFLSSGPNGFVSINDDEPYSTNLSVLLTIGATSDAVLMMISEIETFVGATWEPIQAHKEITLDGDGTKRVFIKFADAGGLESAAVFDEIIVNTNPIVVSQSPIDGSTIDDLTPIFAWSNAELADARYDMQIATDSSFANIVHEASNLPSPLYEILVDLENLKPYFWRIRAVAIDGNPWAWSESSGFSIDTILSTLVYDSTITFGGVEGDSGKAIALDSNDNVIVAGYFNGTVDFDAGTGTDWKSELAGPNGDYFITKINADQSYGWTHVISSNDRYGGSKSLAVDSNDNIYFTGQNTARNLLIAKLNPTGVVEWSQTITGDGYAVAGQAIDVDSNDNIYVVGTFYGTADFDAGVGVDNATSVGESDVFLVRINSDGTHGWIRTFGGIGYDFGSTIELDALDNIFLAGTFSGSVDFDTGIGVDSRSSNGYDDIFISKYDTAGSYVWVRILQSVEGDDDVGALESDAGNNIYVTGAFYSETDFDPLAGIDARTPVGSGDVFLTQINIDGSYGWTVTFGGDGSDNAHSIAVGPDGDVYTLGTFSVSVDFSGGDGVGSKTSNGDWDIYICKHTIDGTYLGTVAAGSVSGEGDIGESLAIANTGLLYTTGRFFLDVDFDPGPSESVFTSIGDCDAFVTRYVTQ